MDNDSNLTQKYTFTTMTSHNITLYPKAITIDNDERDVFVNCYYTNYTKCIGIGIGTVETRYTTHKLTEYY